MKIEIWHITVGAVSLFLGFFYLFFVRECYWHPICHFCEDNLSTSRDKNSRIIFCRIHGELGKKEIKVYLPEHF